MQPTSPYPPESPRPQASPPQQTPSTPTPQGPASLPAQAYGTPSSPIQQGQNTAPPPHDYSFIMNPEAPRRQRSFSLPSGTSGPIRALFIVGGLLLLLIVFIIIKGAFFKSGGNLEPFVGIAQQQQELIHLATNAAQQENISAVNKNAALTTQLSLTSAQSDLITYLKNNGKKVSAKTLNLQVSTALDTELTNSLATNTYDQTFSQIIQSKLTTYRQSLKQIFAQTKGPKGRALLTKQYAGATLLLQQLTAPSS